MEKKEDIGLLLTEKRMEARDGLSMPVHCITQRKDSLRYKWHKCVTRISIIEESRDGPTHYSLNIFVSKY